MLANPDDDAGGLPGLPGQLDLDLERRRQPVLLASKKRRRLDSVSPQPIVEKELPVPIPTLTPNSASNNNIIDALDFSRVYDTFQLAYFPRLPLARPSSPISESASALESESESKSKSAVFASSDIPKLFSSLSPKDQSSGVVENYIDDDNNKGYKGEGGAHNIGPFLRRYCTAPESTSTAGTNTLDHSRHHHQRGYCSFIVSNEDQISFDNILTRLPLSQLKIGTTNDQDEDEDEDEHEDEDEDSTTDGSDAERHVNSRSKTTNIDTMKMTHGPCLWFFVGRNDNIHTTAETNAPPPQPLEGRPEHTDSVSHDGTWHYQLSGKKTWRLRPTGELLMRMVRREEEEGRGAFSPEELEFWKVATSDEGETSGRGGKVVEIECGEGDVLLLNTRLWWHSTVIPVEEYGVPSISYARDLYFSKDDDEDADRGGKEEQQVVVGSSPTAKKGCVTPQGMTMTNLDGLYAADNIESGTILFTEDTMPDCELHRSQSDYNCELIELEDGLGAVISCCDIKAGDFFCVMETDDEFEDDGEEEEEEEESDLDG